MTELHPCKRSKWEALDSENKPSLPSILLPQSPSSVFAPHVLASSVQNNITDALNMTEILAELEHERKKNAELLSRLAALEARLEEKDRGLEAKGAGYQVTQVCSKYNISENPKKVKGQVKTGKTGHCEAAESRKLFVADIEVKQEQGLQNTGLDLTESYDQQDVAVSWMACEDMLPPDSDKAMMKVDNSGKEESLETDDSDDDDDEDDDDNSSSTAIDEYDFEYEKETNQTRIAGMRKIKRCNEGKSSSGFHFSSNDELKNSEKKIMDVKAQSGHILSHRGLDDDKYDGKSIAEKRLKKKKRKIEEKKFKLDDTHHAKTGSSYDIPGKTLGMVNSCRKVLKTAFCPMEVKRIMESGVLALKNAQSHTMRKIIVFSSLCIRHGCEDLYELDFSHFSILRRGEPYISAKDPGEHVLYEQPGFRRKFFYPNRQNPILCPVHILDEERTMRPSNPSCPSCLFLCIKYGGRTRNLPQNEYVRQRMGRNKLKSFGPLMCQMALLVHVRTGSFFFKALGITLLFMAGFSEDVIRRETKYHNLELLQKYYRSDSDTTVDQLFHPYPSFYGQALLATSTKASSPGSKSSGKRTSTFLSKNSSTQTGSFCLPPIAARPLLASSFGALGLPGPTVTPLSPHCPFLPYSTTISSCRSVTQTMSTSTPVSTTAISGPSMQHFQPPPYCVFPPYGIQRISAGGVPLPLWAPVNSFPPSPFSSHLYGFQPLSSAGQYVSSPAYYTHPIFPVPSSIKRENEKKENENENSDSDSESSSSGVDEKSERENTSDSKSA